MTIGNPTGLLDPSLHRLGGNTRNRKLPPIRFLIGWNRLQKDCFFLHGNELIQSRCREMDIGVVVVMSGWVGELGKEVVSHR